ncbi:MAG: hypothetical protein PHC83_00640 [Bacteroidales bacterium]|nr:hypothetical protein [Bacteroidales bacterium]MDD4210546.1 hypothetical protein [Bacteroidales bacterium]
MILLPPPIISYPDIMQYLPQRPPMVMVDFYYGEIDEEAYTSFFIKEDNVFVEDGIFTEMGILDFLAQSGIVQMGHKIQIPEELKASSMGVITQFKSFHVHATASVGDTIYGKVKKIFSNAYSASLYVTAFFEDSILIEGTLTAMLIDNNRDVIK